jgi:hypothetical protein
MAEGKKSFVLYADLIKNIDHLTNEEKGILFNHLLEYVNDMNPVLEDRVILSAWKFIQSQLKRDLVKFDEIKVKRSEAGKKSAELRALKKEQQKQKASTNPTSVKSVQQSSTNPTVNVNENVNVNVNEIIDKSITYTKNDFLIDWNVLRLKHLNKPSFLNTLRGEDLDNFTELTKDYSQDDFKYSLVGLFRQKKLPNNQTSMQSNPKHFLKFFNTYFTAYHDKNTNLYGKENTDDRGA